MHSIKVYWTKYQKSLLHFDNPHATTRQEKMKSDKNKTRRGKNKQGKETILLFKHYSIPNTRKVEAESKNTSTPPRSQEE